MTQADSNIRPQPDAEIVEIADYVYDYKPPEYNHAVDWDFRGANTRRMTHGMHPYPAMMIPQIPERLLTIYGSKAKLLFDPYCGSGSSLLEANIRGINAVGTDLNPLARLIALAKTGRINCQKTARHIRDFNRKLANVCRAHPPPPFKNIDFWFSPKAQRDLAYARDLINEIEDSGIRRFFGVAFSETVRECSYTRNGEFKLYRMAAAKMEEFSPDVFGAISAKLARNLEGMKQYVNSVKNPGHTRVFGFNTVNDIPHKYLEGEPADIVITSPPYGDSKTTVAYGQFSRLANEWLEFEKPSAVDRSLMGGVPSKNGDASLGCELLDAAIARIGEQSPVRAREIRAFYEDYRQSIAHVATAIKPGGYACYVVGNRKSKGVELPTDCATKSFFSENGFIIADTYVRNIPNKRMPSKNSPSNVPGVCDTTMQREHIIVMQRKN